MKSFALAAFDRFIADGKRWVWVATPAQLRAEGAAMRHCVGQGGYQDLPKGSAILSLRDVDGTFLVTTQLVKWRVHQAVSTGNSLPTHPHHVDDLARHCGSHLQLHGRPGWATDEEVETASDQRKSWLAPPSIDRGDFVGRIFVSTDVGVAYPVPTTFQVVADGLGMEGLRAFRLRQLNLEMDREDREARGGHRIEGEDPVCAERPEPVPFHLQGRNPRSPRQARRLGKAA